MTGAGPPGLRRAREPTSSASTGLGVGAGGATACSASLRQKSARHAAERTKKKRGAASAWGPNYSESRDPGPMTPVGDYRRTAPARARSRAVSTSGSRCRTFLPYPCLVTKETTIS